MSITWRWAERDFGLRFRDRSSSEFYQGPAINQYYIVPEANRKLTANLADSLTRDVKPPALVNVVANPWDNYELDWDWITAGNGEISINYAGCLDAEEVRRREDEGVSRALEFVTERLQREEPEPLTIDLIRDLHLSLMGVIYPFAGAWRMVDLTKGDGPTKWPLPPAGIEHEMRRLEREVLSRSPFLSENDAAVFGFASEVMNEFLAIHPFREGNGRTAFMIANLVLLQNDLAPLDTFERKRDQQRYFDACEAGRIHKDYEPLATLLQEWEGEARARWEGLQNG